MLHYGYRLLTSRVRRFHRRRSGIVIEQACMMMVLVLPIVAATPMLVDLFRDYFYRLSVVIASPFT